MKSDGIHVASNQCFAIQGEINYQTVNTILRQGILFFSNSPSEVITVDLHGLSTVNSVSIALLVEWKRAARRKHKKLVFSRLPAKLTDAIKANNLEAVINAV